MDGETLQTSPRDKDFQPGAAAILGSRLRPLIGVAAVVAAAGTVAWAALDFRAWHALGTGGLPPTWRGWLRTTWLRMRAADPFATEPLLSRIGGPDDTARLGDLPRRQGSRPRVGPHPVPHRQLNGHSPDKILEQLRTAFDLRVKRDEARLCYALSHFEKHTAAVTLRPACRHSADARLAHGEIAHIHPSDGSMHMVLGPSDTRTVIECGWGERHGLAGIALGLPATYTLIYAPRDREDVDMIAAILDAAIAHASSPTA